jgi:formylglycine-generating enzyme required for sulfatase activity
LKATAQAILGLLVFTITALAQDARFFRIAGPVPVRITNFTQDGTVTWTNTPTNATFTVLTATNLVASNWEDWRQVTVSNATTTIHQIFAPPPPANMAFIPAGSFVMGDSLDSSQGGTGDERPLHNVYVSAFYMDKYEVTKTLWDEVRQWGATYGYTDLFVGGGKAGNHPVRSINWYNMVKWCNARSEKEGRVPAYYTDAQKTVVYRTGNLSLTNECVKWDANGYRLPTEAEWEKAARGELNGQRFPWGDIISHGQANYYAYPSSYAYDVNPTEGYHPSYNDGVTPYTSPVGSFAPNGYGLYDMAGNLDEWCWDWYASNYYNLSSANDPLGPTSGSYRVGRGGNWRDYTTNCRTAQRYYQSPTSTGSTIGFRCVFAAGQ